jgi:lipoprotein-anchoring transpeptidase ErfK/SrfK
MRRRAILISSLLVVLLATGAGVTAHASSDRQRTFADGAGALRATWSRDEALGVPAASLAPLRAQLASQAPSAGWWSPSWLSDDGAPLLARLQTQTQSVWKAAVDQKRTEAQGVVAQWAAFATQQGEWLSSDATTPASRWTAELEAASTPADIARLMATWRAFIAQQRTAVTAAQQAKLLQLQQELQSAGGPEAVLATAQNLVDVASADNLDAGDVAALAAQLRNQIAANSDATQTGSQLLVAVNALQLLVNLNDQVAGQVRPLLLTVDQAEAEHTPNAAALAAADGAIAGQFGAARTIGQLTAVAQTIATVSTQVNAELAANQCGHNVGSGKVITVSLSLQEMVFYQDGCVVKATPVSTGRPELRTPTGTFSIFNKQTPFQFISPWPKSSPYYYEPSWVSWVMEFASGGYFIHDAPWESADAYGPGSEDNPWAASHGCIHVPTPVMQWAYSWTPDGAVVSISA